MKFLKKVDENFLLKNLFNEHLNKFNLKHEQELIFLEDVRNFVQRKSQIELQYSQALSKLCQQYLNKPEYQIQNDEQAKIYIPEKWKQILEQYSYVAEKKQVSSRSLLMHCDYFESIRKQKLTLNDMAINNLKKLQKILTDSNSNRENSFKAYCVDQYMCNQFNDKKKLNDAHLEKKLKKRKINHSKFKKTYDQLIKDELSIDEKKKLSDFSKLAYVTSNCCYNQQLQYYFSMEIPQLLNLQNGNIDSFINECINSLVFKEIDNSRFLERQFQEALVNSALFPSKISAGEEAFFQNASETFFINNNECFNSLIQQDFEPYDSDFDDLEFTFQKTNMKHLSNDYLKWSSKLSELEMLMQTMLEKINQKRFNLDEQTNESADTSAHSADHSGLNFSNQNDFKIDAKLEEQRFLIAEKKMQMIQLQAKIDALGCFNINLKELEDYNKADNFEKNKREFYTDLYQNLELWDTLMKSIDEIQYSDDSYDVDYVRKSTTSSTNSALSQPKSSEDDDEEKNGENFQQEKTNYLILSDHNLAEPSCDRRYAKTLCSFESESNEYLSYANDESLIIFDQISLGVYKAKNYASKIGLVEAKNLQFYSDESTYVKSIYAYDGVDERELSFAGDCYIRLLRKNYPYKKFDNEEWWEGVYEDHIGHFPSIFVQLLGDFNKCTSNSNDEDLSSEEKNALSVNNNNTMDTNLNLQNSNLTQECAMSPTNLDNQKVPL